MKRERVGKVEVRRRNRETAKERREKEATMRKVDVSSLHTAGHHAA